MKAIHFFLPAVFLLLSACGTSKAGGEGANSNLNEEVASDQSMANQINNSLADILRKNSSLIVQGSGSDVKVFVRSMSSIQGNTQPLFVINNGPVGNSYASADNAVNPSEISRVKVLRSASETMTLWGEQGSHGVILIETKTNKRK